MIHSSLRTLVKKNLGNPTSLTSALLDDYIHLAKTRMAADHNWHFLEKTVETTLPASASSLRVKLPFYTTLDMCAIKEIYWVSIAVLTSGTYSQSKKLSPLFESQQQEEYPFPEEEGAGKPRSYAWVRDYLIIAPYPSQELALRAKFGVWPDYITSGEHEYQHQDRLLIAASTAEGAQAEGLETRAAYWNSVYEERLGRAKRDEKQFVGVPQVLGRRRNFTDWAAGRFNTDTVSLVED